jgi:uncharacterized membrane protein YqaE (UPF0057 family)
MGSNDCLAARMQSGMSFLDAYTNIVLFILAYIRAITH